MNSIKNRCMHGVVDDRAEGIIDCLAHAAGRHSKTQFDNVPDYAVAWVGGFIFDRRARTCFNSS